MKHILAVALAGVVVLGAAAAEARADDIPVHATGVGADGRVLAPGVADPHWRVVQTPAGLIDAAATVASAHPVYLQNDPVGSVGSSWISVGASTNASYSVGTYVYRTTFDLTGLDPATAQLSVTFSVDDTVTDVRINGASLGPANGGFVFTTTKSVTAGFVEGVNALDFVVQNSAVGPTGLRVRISGTADSAAPPPDTTAPVFTSLQVTPDVIDRYDHSMVEVAVTAAVTDDRDEAPYVRIVSIESNETASPAAEGTSLVTGDLTALVAAERNGDGSGRIYTITVEATDAAGNSATGTVSVLVPHDQRFDNASVNRRRALKRRHARRHRR